MTKTFKRINKITTENIDKWNTTSRMPVDAEVRRWLDQRVSGQPVRLETAGVALLRGSTTSHTGCYSFQLGDDLKRKVCLRLTKPW